MISCKQPTTPESTSKAPVDSLISAWENAFNKHDSIGVRDMFLTDALLIDDNIVAMNLDEIANKWIHPNINVVANLKSTKLQDWTTHDRAGYTGKYELDVVVKDSVIARPKGFYTVNWMKTDKGDWKITTSTIHSLVEPRK